ncbi:response regulator [Chloroflexota bacterium]
MNIKILIADDHPTFREGLCRFLEEEVDMEIVATPENGEEAVKLAKELQPDVAIIDVAMPKLNGIEAARQIKASHPGIAILMVSAYNYEAYVRAALQAGVEGYVLKSAPIDELVSAIRLVHVGEAVFNMKAASKILRQLVTSEGKERRDLEGLHSRELEILKRVAEGKSNRDIASELFLSERTVQTHMINIFRKLKVNSRTEAVLRALKEGWIVLEDLP